MCVAAVAYMYYMKRSVNSDGVMQSNSFNWPQISICIHIPNTFYMQQ